MAKTGKSSTKRKTKTSAKSSKKKTSTKRKASTAKKKSAATKSAKSKTSAKKKTSTKKKATATKKKAKSKKTSSKAAASGQSKKTEATLPPKKISKAKVLPREFMMDVANAVKKEVVPAMENPKSRDVVGTAGSGDVTFELDEIAEKALLAFLKRARQPVAYYSEESGYTTFTSGTPQHLLVVDPVDGSRAAKNGFEGCVVSIASTRVIERPCISDVDNALVVDIKDDRAFYAERGKGARIYVDGSIRRPKPSQNTELERLSWSMTVPARPAELIFPAAAKLIDTSSLKGGFFACNSTAYSLTRLLTGQYDACVDFANRFYRDIEEVVLDYFLNAGRGVVLGICPYDMAAALLCAEEAGCVVTDAFGNNFDDVMLLDSSTANMRSVIAAGNKALHKKLMVYFETRIRQLELVYERQAKQQARR